MHLSDPRGALQWLSLALIATVLVPGVSLPARPASSGAGDETASKVDPSPPDGTAAKPEILVKPDRSSLHRREASDTPNGNPSMNELKKLQGTWRMLTLEMDGAPMPASAVAGAKIIVEGDQFTTSGMGATYKGTMTIDATKTPKTLDMAFTEGPERGNTSLAIYEVNGDSWKICLGLTGKERPKAFSTAPGSGHALETLEREAIAQPQEPGGKKTDPPVLETPRRDARVQPVKSDQKELDRLTGEWSGVALVMNGQDIPADFFKGSTRVVKGNETTVTIGGQVVLKATFTVDPSKSPKTIDYTIAEGPDKGKQQLGIYEVENELAKFCFSTPGKDRPTEFASKAGDGRTFGTWKKAQK
jgi:uncharacterized protein (TIGR03067 family)